MIALHTGSYLSGLPIAVQCNATCNRYVASATLSPKKHKKKDRTRIPMQQDDLPAAGASCATSFFHNMQEATSRQHAPSHGGHNMSVPLVDLLQCAGELQLVCGILNWWRLFQLLEGLHIPVAHLHGTTLQVAYARHCLCIVSNCTGLFGAEGHSSFCAFMREFCAMRSAASSDLWRQYNRYSMCL
jgi:hypothetical protein